MIVIGNVSSQLMNIVAGNDSKVKMEISTHTILGFLGFISFGFVAKIWIWRPLERLD
jgi:hypothetical protein